MYVQYMYSIYVYIYLLNININDEENHVHLICGCKFVFRICCRMWFLIKVEAWSWKGKIYS